MKFVISYFLSHSLFFIVAAILSSFVTIVMLLPFLALRSKPVYNRMEFWIYFLNEFFVLFVIEILLFSHYTLFVKGEEIGSNIVFYMIIGFSILVYINEAQRINSNNELIIWRKKNRIIRYLTAATIFILMILFPEVYSIGTIELIPQTFINLTDNTFSYVLMIISAIGLFLLYFKTIIKINFTNRKKKLAYEMIEGVDKAKMILFKVISDSFIKRLGEDQKEKAGMFAASAVNEIFGCHTAETKHAFNENKELIETQLFIVIKDNPILKGLVTNSLRVYIQSNFMLGSSLMKDMDYVNRLTENAHKLGFFMKGGEAPQPHEFLLMVNTVGKKFGIV